MCGIFCCFSKSSEPHSCLENDLLRSLQKRGPDAQSVLNLNTASATFAGFVLWHQGVYLCKQPMESSEYVLLFNGDIFNLEALTDASGISDTEWLFHKLSKCSTDGEILNCFRLIEGPYCLIFYDKLEGNIYFARDSLGRNSLLIENTKDHLRILSTSRSNDENKNTTVELPPLGIFKINIKNFDKSTVFPWHHIDDYWKSQANILESVCGIKLFVEQAVEPYWFSQQSSLEKYTFNFYSFDAQELSAVQLYDHLLKDKEILEALREFSSLLENSVKQRVQLTTKVCAKCSILPCNHSKVAILFSGGIDCTILALLADKFVDKADSIDLINVSFQQANSELENWNVPDRESARQSLADLKALCPNRTWNFIEVNVTRKTLYTNLKENIKHLIYPLNTVLDESIGCAFWFASQGYGLLDGSPFESNAKVVIVGSGADELFGGYIRHKNAYKRCNGTHEDKEKCLYEELEMDWQRIPTRNLARDDRVIADSGRTPRSPFVEENVVKFARSLKPRQRCCFLYDDGVGDKLFLRLYGYKAGLTTPTFLKKRAIQFGSKIANKKENAKDRSLYLNIKPFDKNNHMVWPSHHV
ncbi:asparagine synthetase domain-containing protein CG17486 isoform X1 [Stomoxys calcitrans]|uniref:asparagine synthetase domain-containing protein CG17486 isoform X1 n=2 Tax=Stomoxys calcitrans TaxID=35570 RepID=UPI0027E332C9|nr:asparagine synthetase domain-containing protein CG17486 isoform X1 [Stomoxys calcitrans]